jgi:hypothetical protein
LETSISTGLCLINIIKKEIINGFFLFTGASMTRTLDVNREFRERFDFTEDRSGAHIFHFKITGKIT